MYCESAAINKAAVANSVKEKYEGKHWLQVADKQANLFATLSTKLGTAVNSALSARRKELAGQAPEQKSKRAGLLFGGTNK